MEKILLFIITILIVFIIKCWTYPALIPFFFLILLLIFVPSLIIKK
ncbi:hypothetical protein [Fusobacterium sp.]|nr:hypothetical protein [Fusobacterium sp.]MDU1911460.1 hypothetical protein [Fusobacterium sp.]